MVQVRDRRAQPLWVWLVFLLAIGGASATYSFHRATLTVSSGVAAPEQLMAGQGHRPFQYRMLVPWLVGLSGRSGLAPALGIKQPRVAFLLVEALFALLLVLAFRAYLLGFLRDPLVATALSPSILLVLPWYFLAPQHLPVFYPSDTPSILAIVLGLLFLRDGRWVPFYAVFVVGTFNRETTCLLTMVYLATHFDSATRRTLAAHSLAQLGCWLAVKGLLSWIYGANPGDPFQWTLPESLSYLPRPWVWHETLTAWIVTWLPACLFFTRIREPFVRRSALAALPMLFGLLMVGNLDEPRVFGDLVPLGLTASILAVRGLASGETAQRSKRGSKNP